MKKVLVIAIALTFVAAAVALAGENTQVKVAVHVKAAVGTCKSGLPAFSSCTGIVFDYETQSGTIYAIPCFFDMAEFTVVEFGLNWPAEWASGTWTKCKGILAIGDIVNPGDGTAISYGMCQTGVTNTVPGYMLLYPSGPGLITPVPNPTTGDLCVVDCTPDPGPYKDFMMCISAGGYLMAGDDPCRPTATQESTWGSIKSMFE